MGRYMTTQQLHRHPGIQQGDRAMLHLTRRVTLRVDVADLLELQRPLQSDRVVDTPAQKNHVLGVGEQVRSAMG